MRDETEAPAPAARQPKLKPANENPWYVLMTLYGEQEGEEIDRDLQVENRRVWNIWASGQASHSKREELTSLGISSPPRDQWLRKSAEIRALFTEEFQRRNPGAEVDVGELDKPSEIDLSRLEFRRPLELSGYLFPADLTISFSSFYGKCSIQEAGFAGRLSAKLCSFGEGLDASYSVFLGDVNFDSSSVEQSTGRFQFAEVKFKKRASFARCFLRGYSDFSHASFEDDANFEDCKFQAGVDFNMSAFSKDVYGRYLWGHDGFDFGRVVVRGTLDLSEASFCGNTSFKNAHFEKTVSLRMSKFEDNADFSFSVFDNFSFFSGTIFGSGVAEGTKSLDFSGATFAKPSNFTSAFFLSAFPDWEGAILHEKFSFTADERNWPVEYINDTVVARESCATIRHILAKQGLPEDEHFFFRREMHFAGRIGSIWQRLPYLLFGLFSEYGYSILRPTLWLLGIWALGFAAFWGYLSGCCVPAPDSVIERPMGAAMALSFSNLFPLFGFGRTFLSDVLGVLPPVLQFFSGVQTVASLPLLFFLGLGLRQRFRLR